MSGGKKLLEVCVDSPESALAARRGGADRLELCGNLIIGGTTPTPGLLSAAREQGLPVHALLRPRFGDFLYTKEEFRLMLHDGRILLEQGADALVSGCLTAEGDLDLPRLRELVDMAHGMGRRFTLHRAFDVCRDPFKALEECARLGVDTVLTSGQGADCQEGMPVIEKLCKLNLPVELMAGAGVNAEVIGLFRRELPQLTSFHMSGKQVLESGMTYRKQGVSMGLPGFSEFELWRTGEEQVRRAREVLDEA